MERPASWRLLAIAFGATVVVFLAAYWESFGVLPAGDDFGYIIEVHRGNRDGVWSFFTRSVTGQTYRPLTSVGLWAFGTLWSNEPTVGIRALHLLSAVIFAGVALLWIRAARLGSAGAIVAIAIMLLHPVLPQAVGSIDGFNSLTSSAFLWLGAWFIVAWRDRVVPALAAASLCFIVGVLNKEYAFALVPLSMLTVLCFWRRRLVRNALIFAVTLGIFLLMSIWVRRFTIPADMHGGWGYVSLHPADLVKNVIANVVMFASGILFFGNSVWVFVNQSPAVLAMVGAWMLVVAGLISWGLVLRYRRSKSLHPNAGFASRPADDPIDSLQRWMVYLLLSLVATTFPAVVMTKISEMYVPPLVLPFALLCGFAADGFRWPSVPVRTMALTVALIALVSSILTIRSKINGLVDVGERADRQIQQILAMLPPDARDQTVVIRYLESDRHPRDRYAVFRLPDHLLLIHEIVLEWPKPQRGLKLDAETIKSFAEVDPLKSDVTLGWDASKQRFFEIGK